MRLFLYLLIFTLIFSGYAAAVHASGMSDFCPDGQEQAMNMADCHDHQQSGEDDQSSKSGAVNCHHCCTSHAGFTANIVADFPPLPKIMSPMLSEDSTGDFVFSLLRPPKTLV